MERNIQMGKWECFKRFPSKKSYE